MVSLLGLSYYSIKIILGVYFYKDLEPIDVILKLINMNLEALYEYYRGKEYNEKI